MKMRASSPCRAAATNLARSSCGGSGLVRSGAWGTCRKWLNDCLSTGALDGEVYP